MKVEIVRKMRFSKVVEIPDDELIYKSVEEYLADNE